MKVKIYVGRRPVEPGVSEAPAEGLWGLAPRGSGAPRGWAGATVASWPTSHHINSWSRPQTRGESHGRLDGECTPGVCERFLTFQRTHPKSKQAVAVEEALQPKKSSSSTHGWSYLFLYFTFS